MRIHTPVLLAGVLLAHGCNKSEERDAELTWYADAKPVVDQRCGTCHTENGIGPFPLTTYDEVVTVAAASAIAIESGSMPPWQPADDCNDYLHSIDLTPVERELLLEYFAGDMPEGVPADEPEVPEPEAGFVPDHSIPLPEPYTPVLEPDDYRCQIMDFSVDREQFITGVGITPDNEAIAHHAIAFIIDGSQREQYEAWDAEEAGPGYSCFGGPGAEGTFSDTEGMSPAEIIEAAENGELQATSFRWLGSWAPGGAARAFPEGTGVPVGPDDFVVVQMHYNTQSAAPASDQSVLEISVADTVERPATTIPFTNPLWVLDITPMEIPAGESVTHTYTDDGTGMILGPAREGFGLADDEPLMVHSSALHMHNLGVSGRLDIQRAGDEDTCLLHLDEWDFAWQGSYRTREEVPLYLGDTLTLSCTWDNSAANQPAIDGTVGEPQDVRWGEGTMEEMCLGLVYVTRP